LDHVWFMDASLKRDQWLMTSLNSEKPPSRGHGSAEFLAVSDYQHIAHSALHDMDVSPARCAFDSPAGVPKDGNRADQRLHTSSLVVESTFGLSAPR
jgi:hypothetical protein